MSKLSASSFQEKLSKLSETEAKYFRIMWAKYGVLFITSKPGIAKSAIARSIANKMGFNYIDMRLSMNDESDFKFPYLEDKEYNGITVKVSNFAVPSWAYSANQSPTIIHFEELNRASLFVRNAALQILLEREIGQFKFNDNVLMLASGNLGDEDGTDIEELDSALNNRLIHISHSLNLNDWIQNFGAENCHPSIVSFIKNNPEKFYVNPDENTKAYATPRSWTMLSEFIVSNYGMNSTYEEFIPMLRQIAHGYIGNTSVKFIKYCEDMLRININDIINNYDLYKNDLLNYNRDKTSELLSSLKDIEIFKLNDKQLKNIVNFINNVGEDEKAAFLLHLLDDHNTLSSINTNPKIKLFFSNFKDTLRSVQSINNR